jgi:alcohol dehydrogenase (cytochrome c)
MGKAYMRQNWLKEFDAKGRPIKLPNIEPTPEGIRLCPGLAGGANWMAPSWDPDTRLFYLPYRDECNLYFSSPPVFAQGKAFWGTSSRAVDDAVANSAVKAIDPFTGEGKWEFRFRNTNMAGTLSTSGGLVFAGDADGYLVALDSKSGKLLWKLNTGAEHASAPMTYMVDGRQYVSMPAGGVLITLALPEADK